MSLGSVAMLHFDVIDIFVQLKVKLSFPSELYNGSFEKP